MPKSHVVFASDLPDEWKWEGEFLVAPGGLEHSFFIKKAVAGIADEFNGPWNEEDYGREFTCRIAGIRIAFLVSSFDETGWLLILISVAFLSFLRRRKVAGALRATSDQVDRALKLENRFRAIRWFTAEELQWEAQKPSKQTLA